MKSKKRYGPTPKEFKPLNREKYDGKWPIICRSSLEHRAMNSLDLNPAVISWNSESLVIPYYDPIKQKKRRYFTDMCFKIRSTDNLIHSYVVEVKMEKETIKPIRGKKKEKTFITECSNYITNTAKWDAAKKFCDGKKWKFVIWSETALKYYRN